MLEHVILKLKSFGVDELVINVHHFAQQIIDFLKEKDNFGIKIWISDETEELLETGGGIKKAAPFFDEPFLVHNADILSNVDLKAMYDYHLTSGNDATLLVSPRKTVRYLLFNETNRLCGWVNKDTLQTKPEGFVYQPEIQKEYAFGGIHIISPTLFKYMEGWSGKFSIMDFYLQTCQKAQLGGYIKDDLHLIDIGKLETLAKAEEFIRQNH
jgi:NDP-sugar pyrophosphorylase family protein